MRYAMRTRHILLVAVFASVCGCGSPKPYQRVGSRDDALGPRRTAACMIGFPSVSVDIYYKGRKTGAWFSGMARNIGANIDRGKNQALYAGLMEGGLGEHTRDAVGDAVEPIVKKVPTLSIRDWLRLPNPQKESTQPMLAKWPELDRAGVDSAVYLYGVPDDSAILKLEVTLLYMERRHGELHVIWRELFAYESETVTHEQLEGDPELATRLMRDGVRALEPWIRWLLTTGKDRLTGKPRQTVTMASGATLTGILLARDGPHVVIRGDEGLVRVIRNQYVKSVDEPDE